jgi:hypothetical protein
MLPATERRVPEHTDQRVNQRIRLEAEERVLECAADPDRIPDRLVALEREWDIERSLEANAAAIGFVGVLLALMVDPWFLVVPAVVTAFLFQHALQGWCPPVPILRRLGFRTAREIEEERIALKAIRGDFSQIGDGGAGAAVHARSAIEAARR